MQATYEKIQITEQVPLHSYVRTSDSFPFKWHFHPEFELTYILKSKGQRFVGDSTESYKEGDLIFLGPNLPHTWSSSKTANNKCQAIVTQFRTIFPPGASLEWNEFSSIRSLVKDSQRGVQFKGKTALSIRKSLLQLTKTKGLNQWLLLISILDQLGRSKEKTVLSSRAYAGDIDWESARRIDKVCRHVEEHFEQPISQPQAASIASLSTSAFSRFFKKQMGQSFPQYVNEIRLGHACKMLIEEDLNITEICYKCGFNNLSNFNRRFLSAKNCSPKEFRSRYHKQ